MASESNLKIGVWGLPRNFFGTTPLKTLESAPFNKYLLLYSYIYMQFCSEEISTAIKTDTHQNFRDMNLWNSITGRASMRTGEHLPPSLYAKRGPVQRTAKVSHSIYFTPHNPLLSYKIFMILHPSSSEFNQGFEIVPFRIAMFCLKRLK